MEITLESLVSSNDIGNTKMLTEVLQLLVDGTLTIAITGGMNTGKSTFAKAMAGETQLFFGACEFAKAPCLNLKEVCDGMDVYEIADYEDLSVEDLKSKLSEIGRGLSVVDEVASDDSISRLVQAIIPKSLLTLFSNHAKSTEQLLDSMAAALVRTGDYKSLSSAKIVVASAIDLDIHLVKDSTGRRYVSRVTEIVKINPDGSYCTRDVIVYDEGTKCYKAVAKFSKELCNMIDSNAFEDLKRITEC